MEIQVSQKQGRVPVTVVRPKDRINMGNTEELEQTLNSALQKGTKYLVIDLSDVPGITSAGLRTILGVAKKLGGSPLGDNQKSPFVKLVNPSSDIAKVFKIAGFDTLFEIYGDLQQAVDSF